MIWHKCYNVQIISPCSLWKSLIKAIANEVLTKREDRQNLSKVIDLPIGQSRLHSTLLETSMCFQKDEKYSRNKHERYICLGQFHLKDFFLKVL